MNKLLLILLLISIDIFAIKIKVKQKENILHTKFIIKNNMISEEIAKRKNLNTDYLKNLTITLDGKIICNAFLSPHMARNPLFKFNFHNYKKGNVFEILRTNYNLTQYKNSVIMDYSSSLIDHPLLLAKYSIEDKYKIMNSKIWKMKTPKEVIKELYGSDITIDDQIKVKVPTETGYLGSIPISIKTDIKFESIAILTDSNPGALIAFFLIPNSGLIDYRTSIKIMGVYYHSKKYYNQPNYEANIIIVGKASDGKLHKTVKNIKFLRCVNSGG